ncbi:hypothetical protein RvY_11898 [Ramazzottius varieornatus]|uniref:DDE-1 domain-containing protein n=1 Tax=Ramazzottius varieornatus TaxID=947166 RepID=A0A1D1VLY0_RAMVA|nr:hypothetical protein RvY_11898 [Ramazzottius varieornatus]
MTKMKNAVFVDGHFSHINNFTLMKYIKEFEAETGEIVYVFALPAGQTNHLQPFDVSVFGQVKRAWGDYLRHRRVVIGGLRGVTPDAVLASPLQASLFAAAPKKVRRETNEHLNLDAGGLTNEENFQSHLEKNRAANRARTASLAASRRATASQARIRHAPAAVPKPPKIAPGRKPLSVKRKASDKEPDPNPSEVLNARAVQQQKTTKASS